MDRLDAIESLSEDSAGILLLFELVEFDNGTVGDVVDVGEFELFVNTPDVSQPAFIPSTDDLSLSLLDDPHRSLDEPMVKSRGLLFSELGVSLYEFESRLLTCFLSRNRSRRLCARIPSHGDLRPISESMGNSFGGSLGPISIGVGLVTDRFSGENA